MATGCRSIALGLASMLAVSCQTTRDLTTPGSGMTARVVASDASRPVGPDGRPVSVTGTATFTGLTVELWDGQQWLTVANGSGNATLALGDGALQATLVPATEIPAGSYSEMRFTAASATLDVAVAGINFSARTQATEESLTLDKTVAVTVNPDGSRTFSVELQLIRTVSLSVDPVTGAPIVTLNGDFGPVTMPAASMRTSVIGSDRSQPVTSPAGMSVSGSATFTGLSVDLWDGQQWWAVANGSGTATFALEDGTAAATLVPASELPAGDYTQIRLTATNAVVDLTLDDGSRQFSAGLQSNGPVVITKSVTVTVNPDGSRTLAVQFEMVRSVALDVDPTSGAASVSVTGDFGAATAAASAR
ncbi:MAG: hypothetical protein DMD65_06020 [Gemmatimonadetes bacterium]|nr:MAG: hypothetical protein DMD65_06020 [Gemmatimonadota bacterium]